ncbi:hypothetical protein [Streptomyces sp. NPDC020965]|uniref:hypothetical protein n=1 Tax=Streptomyces sp. NPDC020965 TaxID=3365105 RepID=UPI0037B407A2
MTSAAETPIDAAPLGTVPTTGTVTPTADGHLALHHDDRLEIHHARTLLAGTLTPLHTLRLPPHARATPLTDGAVIAEANRIRRLHHDGTTRWELPHTPWPGGHQDPRPPGPPAVHPTGTTVSVLIPTSADDTPHPNGPPPTRSDTLLLIDTDTGHPHAQRPISGNTSIATQRWHPSGTLLTLSCWTAWYSWSTWWIQPRHDGLHIRGGTTMREVIDFLPGAPHTTPRILTLRRAEHIAANDDRDELATHDPGADEPTARYDLTRLATERDHDEFDGAFLIDDRHLLITGRIHPPGRPALIRHWLCDATTLQPLGHLRYPRPVGWVTPLGDGTWLTRGTDTLHRWTLPHRP